MPDNAHVLFVCLFFVVEKNLRRLKGRLKWFCMLTFSQKCKLFSFFFQENVLLGSDYPFPLGEPHPGKLIADVYKENTEVRVRTQGTWIL